MVLSDLSERLAFAIEIARAAGASTLETFRSNDLDFETKGDGSPVTRADRAAERLLRERIAARYPDDGVLGEEEGEAPGRSGNTWILDPIDGTFSFVHGVPLFGTLVAMEHERESVVGVVHMPALDELVAAATGLGARWYQPGAPARPAHVSTVGRLADALLCTTSTNGYARAGREAVLERLVSATGRFRGWSDCYGLLLVATGRADLLVEPEMHVWDCAPFLPILEEAGGRFTDLAGERTIRGGSALATNGALFEEALAAICAAGG